MADILFPPGRMVGGSLEKLHQRTGDNGQPKIGKDGQPEMTCNFGCAIPKAGESHWSQTPWGKVIYETGAAAHPNLVASPAFAWKIIDGDSTLPNKKGKIPAQQTGYAGHWVIWFSQGWMPKLVNADGTVELPAGSIVPGYYIQVYGNVAGNKMVPNGTPGVYLNPIAVALRGEGDKIATDIDTTAVGFGQGALPAGARPVTAAAPQFAAPPVAQPPVAPVAAPPAMPPAAAPPAMPPQYNPPVGIPVGAAPAPSFLTPGAPPAPPVPAGPVMTPAAQYTYEQYKASGWTDDMLRAQGLMQ